MFKKPRPTRLVSIQLAGQSPDPLALVQAAGWPLLLPCYKRCSDSWNWIGLDLFQSPGVRDCRSQDGWPDPRTEGSSHRTLHCQGTRNNYNALKLLALTQCSEVQSSAEVVSVGAVQCSAVD